MTSTLIDRLDGLSSAAAIKGPCRVATTANIALYGEQTIDGVAVVDGDRVLVKDQTAGYENGIYVVDTGQWRRSKDFNKTKDVVKGTAVFVTDGDTYTSTRWVVDSENPVIIGTTSISFIRDIFSGAGSSLSLAAFAGLGSLALSVMFATGVALGVNNFTIPRGLAASAYTTASAISFPAGSVTNIDPQVTLSSTYDPVQVADENNRAQWTIGAGATVNWLFVHLDTGVNTINQVVWAEENARIGFLSVTSSDFNNNRTLSGSSGEVAGALVIYGDDVHIGGLFVDNFDKALTLWKSNKPVITHASFTNCGIGWWGAGVYGADTDYLYFEGASIATAAGGTGNGRGNMTPGYNGIGLAGVGGSRFGRVVIKDSLEHAIREGRVYDGLPGITQLNSDNSYESISIYRPYGSGFKQDDGDDGLIEKTWIGTLYTEDVGHNGWGLPDYSPGGMNGTVYPGNDGNKEACAIRNSRYVTIGQFMNRAVAYANSGYFGLWIERSSDVSIGCADVEKARVANIEITSNGQAINRINVASGRACFATGTGASDGHGVRVQVNLATDVARGIKVNVSAEGNAGYGLVVPNRDDAASGFIGTETSQLIVFARSNTLGASSIGAAVAVDPDCQITVTASARPVLDGSNTWTGTQTLTAAATAFILNGGTIGSAGTTVIDINPNSILRLGRSTNDASFTVQITTGLNSTSVQHNLKGNGDSYVNAQAGNFGVGTASPAAKLDVSGAIAINGISAFTAARHPVLRSYTVATLPTVTSATGQIIYVSDGTANKRLAICDGTNWRFPDGAIVS